MRSLFCRAERGRDTHSLESSLEKGSRKVETEAGERAGPEREADVFSCARKQVRGCLQQMGTFVTKCGYREVLAFIWHAVEKPAEASSYRQRRHTW